METPWREESGGLQSKGPQESGTIRHTHACTCRHTHKCTHIHTCARTHRHTHIHAHTRTHIHAQTYTYMCTHTHIHACAVTHMHTHICARAHARTHTHTHTRGYLLNPVSIFTKYSKKIPDHNEIMLKKEYDARIQGLGFSVIRSHRVVSTL